MKLEDIKKDNESQLGEALTNLSGELNLTLSQNARMRYANNGHPTEDHPDGARMDYLLSTERGKFVYAVGVRLSEDKSHGGRVYVQIKDTSFFDAYECDRINTEAPRTGGRGHGLQPRFQCSELWLEYDNSGGFYSNNNVLISESDGGIEGRIENIAEADDPDSPVRRLPHTRTGYNRMDERTDVYAFEVPLENSPVLGVVFDSFENVVRTTHAKLERYAQHE